MKRTFNFYEYAGIVIPGAVLVMALVWLFPESRALFSKEGVTLGELGMFVIIAYAAGQLVQAIGNYLEWAWWKPWGGMPSGQVLCGKYLSTDQHKRLLDALRPVLGDSDPCTRPQPERLAIVREVYSEVASAGKAGRVDTFSGSYGLMRSRRGSIRSLFELRAGRGQLTSPAGVGVEGRLRDRPAIRDNPPTGQGWASEIFWENNPWRDLRRKTGRHPKRAAGFQTGSARRENAPREGQRGGQNSYSLAANPDRVGGAMKMSPDPR